MTVNLYDYQGSALLELGTTLVLLDGIPTSDIGANDLIFL